MLPKTLAAKWLKEKKKSKRFTIDTLPAITSVSDFNEEIQQIGAKYKLDLGSIQNALEGLMSFISSKKSKNDLFGDEAFGLYLQINGFKVPQSHSKIARIMLKHSYYSADSDVCLIVPDVKGIQNKNHEEHVEFYEKLLAQKGVNNIKKIMTFHELRTEYETYELKHRLVELYDLFLVDGKIAGKTVKKCKIFYKKSKIATAIKLDGKVRQNIEVALKKTPLYLHSRGDSFRVKIGNSEMPTCDLVENILYIVKGLDRVFPGGFSNIRSLLLGGSKGIKIPVYLSLKSKNDVIIPDDPGNPVEEVTGELSTKLNTHVKVKTTGEVTVIKVDDNGVELPKQEKRPSEDKSGAKKKQKLEKGSKKKQKKNKKLQ